MAEKLKSQRVFFYLTRLLLVVLLLGGLLLYRKELLLLSELAVQKGKELTDIQEQDTDVIAHRNESARVWARIPLHELTSSSGSGIPDCSYPYVPALDMVEEDPYDKDNETATGKGRKIPRYVHLAWLSNVRRGRCIHHLQALTLKKWKQALPNYSIYFHDDDAVERLLLQENWPEFPHLTKVIQCAKMRGAMLIDIWRILVLYRYGGLYSDMDLWPGPPLNEDTIPAEADFFSLSDAWGRPSQWMFGFSPGHPAGYYTMLEILKRLLSMESIADPSLVFTTGPDALKFGYARAFFWKKDIIFEDGLHHGQYNTTARKIGYGISNDYVTTNMNDIIVVNATFNMTVKEKIKADTGNIHWVQEQLELKQKVPHMHCNDYLYMLERQAESFPHNRKN